MRPLAGCPLSQPQFATLTVLVQLNLDDDGGGPGRDEGDASGGTPPPRRLLRRAVLRESTTVITPLTHLPERSARGAVEGLCGRLMGQAGMRDDLDDDGGDDDRAGGGEDRENEADGGNPAEAPRDADGDENEGDEEKSPRVRFDSGTKGPSTPSSEPSSLPPPEVPEKPKLVRVGTYAPPRHVAPGLTVYHAALRVDDLRAALEEEKADGESYRSRSLTALNGAASALLPGTDLPSLVSDGPAQPCLVVLAVGSAGPPCDLHGSPFLMSLPGRIREFLDLLSSPDLPGDAGSGRLRLVRAVMAGVLDDGSGIMLDHDSLGPSKSSKRDARDDAAPGKVTDSTTGLMASRRGLPTSTGSVRSATPRGPGRFTFTMRRGASRRDGPAPSSLPDDGGGDGEDPAANNPAGDGGEDGGHDHAGAARESAARLELLSLAVPDMGLGRYENAGGGGRRPGSPRRRGGPGTPRGGGGFGAPSGRFGRPPAPRSDLSGFECRPPRGGVPGAVPPAPSSDDISTSGDTSAYSVSSVSSQVPTLTRSRRDTGGGGGGSSRSRFLARKRRSPRASSSAGMGTGGGMGPIDESGPSPSHSVRTSGSVQTEWHRSEDEPAQRREGTHDPLGTDGGGGGGTLRSAASSAPAGTPPTGGGGETPRSAASAPSVDTPSSVGSADSASAVLTLSPLPTRSSDGDGALPASPASVAEESAGSVAEESAASVATEPAGDEEDEDEFAASPLASPPRPAAEGGVGGGDGPPSPPPARIGVSVALNEDLTCEYRGSRLSSLSVEGTVQVRVSKSSSDDDDGGEEQGGQDGGASRPGPFGLLFRDPSGHIRALQENKKYVSGSPGGPTDVPGRVFAYSVDVPRGGEYFPVVRYKCSSSLRPVPVRVQSRIRTQGNLVRVALQVSSNPRNPSDLSHLTITMSVPGDVRGETLQCSPAGGVWDGALRTVHWRVSGLGPGEKFQLQSVFEAAGGDDGGEEEGDGADAAGLEFPVLARCQCQGAQLSDVGVDAAPSPLFPAEVSRDLVRRFRVSHRETQADTA